MNCKIIKSFYPGSKFQFMINLTNMERKKDHYLKNCKIQPKEFKLIIKEALEKSAYQLKTIHLSKLENLEEIHL